MCVSTYIYLSYPQYWLKTYFECRFKSCSVAIESSFGTGGNGNGKGVGEDIISKMVRVPCIRGGY